MLATAAANSCMRGLYSSGVWLRPNFARSLAMQGLTFLRLYSQLALAAFQQRVRRFALIPKLHYFHHLMVDLLEQSAGPWSLNPLVYSVQQQEDYIGRPSRVSRRVSAKSHAIRTVQRVLLAMFAEFEGGKKQD